MAPAATPATSSRVSATRHCSRASLDSVQLGLFVRLPRFTGTDPGVSVCTLSADKATMDAIVKPVANKLGKGEAAADVAALVWGMATLGYAAPAVVSKAAAALKAGAAKLTAGQAISGAWGLAVLGSGGYCSWGGGGGKGMGRGRQCKWQQGLGCEDLRGIRRICGRE